MVCELMVFARIGVGINGAGCDEDLMGGEGSI